MSIAVKRTEIGNPTESANRLVLGEVDWRTYRQMGELLQDRPIRMTFCDGVLEIMTLSSRHENLKRILASLIEMLLLELRIPARRFGSMTCLRDDLEKGLEPDECYWIANAGELNGRQDIDLNRDPPPDLAIEIEVSRRIKERWKIYAELEVPEVWSWSGEEVLFRVLKNGKYQSAKKSKAFPFLSAIEMTNFAVQMLNGQELHGLIAFQEWLRKRS